ncbi:acyl carrier protein [Hymenobacter sp. GOD-10R]|uniref:acyl carrier protein n=1 Tax=Hymenobacter sp. GOD-10R TaxID=3093922 RepID=UPI002D78CAEB|nr:phosphopantetheine-binding protein [Hymenobacter sp. GOD-10R]WRQ31709.1 phosphopantetheine-binding protein [Hymenobacter sp. GOD-10R]
MTTPIQQVIHRLLSKQLRRRLAWVTPSTRLVEDLGFELLDQVNLVWQLEKTYQIIIPDPEIDDLRTVQDVVTCVQSHLVHYVLS